MKSDPGKKDNMSKDNKQVSERVVRLQNYRHCSDEDMASILGVSKGHFIRKLKSGKASFTQDTLTALAGHGFDVNYILTGKTTADLPELGASAHMVAQDEIMDYVSGLEETEKRLLLKRLFLYILVVDDEGGNGPLQK